MTTYEIREQGGIYTVYNNGRVVAEGRGFTVNDGRVRTVDENTFVVHGPNLVVDERDGRLHFYGEFGGVSL